VFDIKIDIKIKSSFFFTYWCENSRSDGSTPSSTCCD